jgi:hypothetical protein
MENERNLHNLNPKPESKQDEFYKELKILTPSSFTNRFKSRTPYAFANQGLTHHRNCSQGSGLISQVLSLHYMSKGISTLHLQTSLFIKSCSRIALILVRSCIDVDFVVVNLTPLKSFFYYGFGQ